MLPLITTKIKDDTLQWLCQYMRPGDLAEIDHNDLLNLLDVDFDTLLAMLEDFEELGLVTSLTSARNGIDGIILLSLKIKAHTFIQQGGFAVLDALTEANIQKILLELDNLKKQLKPDQVEAVIKLTSIASAIATVFAAFPSNN